LANDIKLQEGHPVDEYLRPIKVGGEMSSLEISQAGSGARVGGDLEATGKIRGNFGAINIPTDDLLSGEPAVGTRGYFNISIPDIVGATTISTNEHGSSNNGHLTLNAAGQVYVNPSGSNASLYVGDQVQLNSQEAGAGGSLYLKSVLDSGDYSRIYTTANGVTTFITVDSTGTAANLTFDVDGTIYLDSEDGYVYFRKGVTQHGFIKTATADTLQLGSSSGYEIIISTGGGSANIKLDSAGDIILDSNDGNFIAKKAGTEFSAANSAYAGMILGLTHVFGSGTGGVFVAISTTWENLVWDTDKFALVTFVVPPSNKVKIGVHLPYIAANSVAFQLGLATDSSATPLNTKYQNDVDDANRADSFNINYSWVVEGSDHSWSAGETKTIYIMAYAASSIRFYTGGTNASGYGGVIVEAVALPATIGDGSEP